MSKLYEFWKPVKGFEDTYQISNWGECKSVARLRKGRGNSLVPVPEKILKPKIDKDGYKQYALCLGEHKKMKYFRAHRLVAEAFIPNPNNLPLINHINGNRRMNLADNLEWCDAQHNRVENSQKQYHPVVCNGVFYESVRCLAREINVSASEIRRYLNASRHNGNGLFHQKYSLEYF